MHSLSLFLCSRYRFLFKSMWLVHLESWAWCLAKGGKFPQITVPSDHTAWGRDNSIKKKLAAIRKGGQKTNVQSQQVIYTGIFGTGGRRWFYNSQEIWPEDRLNQWLIILAPQLKIEGTLLWNTSLKLSFNNIKLCLVISLPGMFCNSCLCLPRMSFCGSSLSRLAISEQSPAKSLLTLASMHSSWNDTVGLLRARQCILLGKIM